MEASKPTKDIRVAAALYKLGYKPERFWCGEDYTFVVGQSSFKLFLGHDTEKYEFEDMFTLVLDAGDYGLDISHKDKLLPYLNHLMDFRFVGMVVVVSEIHDDLKLEISTCYYSHAKSTPYQLGKTIEAMIDMCFQAKAMLDDYMEEYIAEHVNPEIDASEETSTELSKSASTKKAKKRPNKTSK